MLASLEGIDVRKKICKIGGIQMDHFSLRKSASPATPRRTFAILTGLTILLATAAAAQTPAPPVLNSPYVCANGITYTVTVCKPWHRGRLVVRDTEKQNGQVVNTMDAQLVLDGRPAEGMHRHATAPATPGGQPQRSAPQPAHNRLQSRVPERVPHSRPDHGADERLERAGYRESPIERVA